MGFWSKLAKGLAIGGAGLGTVLSAGAASPALAGALGLSGGTAALGGAAATAGSSLLGKISKGLGAVAPVASGIAAGQQKGREATNTAAQDAANFKLKESGQNEAGLENRAQLDLKQREDARTGQGDAYKKALQSALAMNMQDAKISGLDPSIPMVHFSGGARPSAIGAEGKAAAGALNKQAMERLLAGEKFDALPALERTGAPEFKQPGALENIAGGVGMAGNAISSVNAANEQKTYQQKILDAIESITKGSTGGQTALGPNKVSTSGAAGVQPFVKPPTAKFPQFGEVGDGDESNR